MWFQVNPRLSTPIYQQLVDGIKESIARGILHPNEKLPSVRELATTMTLNHNTVAKAYQQLEREHVIEVIQGRGTFILELTKENMPDYTSRIRQMTDVMKHLLIEAHYLNLSDDDVLLLFRETMRDWEKGRDVNDHGY